MSYEPIPFENKPSTATPVSAENLNHMQQGIILAVERSRSLDDAWKDGSLNGKNGINGTNGVQGPIGPAGRSFEIDGFAEKLADLPPASLELKNQIWVTYEFGHLHFCDGAQWIDWGQFVGVQGERGPQGEAGNDGVFDIDEITQIQISQLHAKLKPLNDALQWDYKIDIGGMTSSSSPVKRFKMGDSNLDLEISYLSTNFISLKCYPNDTQKSSTYYIRRLESYGTISWEGGTTPSYNPLAITSAGYMIDNNAYSNGQEQQWVLFFDPLNDLWYRMHFFGLRNTVIYMHVEKVANNGFIDI